MWILESFNVGGQETLFVTVVTAPLLNGLFREPVDMMGDVGPASVLIEIFPPQAPESVATGILQIQSNTLPRCTERTGWVIMMMWAISEMIKAHEEFVLSPHCCQNFFHSKKLFYTIAIQVQKAA